MVGYAMKSDKTFLRCLDVSAIELYEVDNPYTYPVKGKHWSHLGISIGPGKRYESLMIGDKEISGADLQTLMKDLFNSRLIVNREGLCFLATTGVTAVVLELEYYRLFDLFDWSPYEVTTSLTTKWARCDFRNGRPLSILGCNSNSGNNCKSEKGKELEKEKRRHKEELMEERRKKEEELKVKDGEIIELKHKHNEDLSEERRKKEEELRVKNDEMVEVKRKHNEELAEERHKKKQELQMKDGEIVELKRKHKEELVEEGRKKQQELKKKQDEIDELKRKSNEPLGNLDKELRLYVFSRSDLLPHPYKFSDINNYSNINGFYRNMVNKIQADIHWSWIKISVFTAGQAIVRKWPPTREDGLPPIYVPLAPIQSHEGWEDGKHEVSILHNNPKISMEKDFDIHNWKTFLMLQQAPAYGNSNPIFASYQAYYDGNKYQTHVDYRYSGKDVIPTPCSPEYMRRFNFNLQLIPGVGYRVFAYFSFRGQS